MAESGRRRGFRLPLTERERELALEIGIEDLDLARRVRLPPATNGWVTLSLTEDELESLLAIGREPWVGRLASVDADLQDGTWVYLTLDQVERLLRDTLGSVEEERVHRLDQRLHRILGCFDPGRDR